VGHRAVFDLNRWLLAALAVAPTVAYAHEPGSSTSGGWGACLVFLFALSAAGYVRGVFAVWRKAGVGRGIRKWDVARFIAGWSLLAAALLPPVDTVADRSFALHMGQHETLMVIAAPLLALSRALEAWTWALPADMRKAWPRFVSTSALRLGWHRLTSPAVAGLLHALALWIWHVPALFLAALASEGVHVLQHTCFLASALVFWWAVFGRRSRVPDATSIALLFTTMLHTSALGLLLTFAPVPWYVHGGPGAFGLTPLEDQQLGGLLMWVPGSLAYVIAGLAIVAHWLASSTATATAARLRPSP
jgi:putative membrane protein